MDCIKTGLLIKKLRCEKNMTQLALAEQLGVSDKAVSKWERGMGCPDISLLNDLASLLSSSVEALLEGEQEINVSDGGNMRNIKFYICAGCGNVITSISAAEIYCCGQRLAALEPTEPEAGKAPHAEICDNELYITFDHAMTKENFIDFVAYVAFDRVLIIRLYPEQEAAVRFAYSQKGTLYYHSRSEGLKAVKLSAIV